LAPGVAAAGGLHVIVTEFNDSPRIDRQLIGRAARQGDPGSWEALVSREDLLFRTDAPAILRRHGPLGLVRRIAQWSAQRRHAKHRRAVQAWERHRQRTLAFSGS
jgi:preprotein translocase subunit SecA